MTQPNGTAGGEHGHSPAGLDPWDIVHDKAKRAEPVFEELIRQAAQGDVLFNDDTTVKILELMDARAREETLAEGNADSSADASASKATDRKGMFTSGIVSTGEGTRSRCSSAGVSTPGRI